MTLAAQGRAAAANRDDLSGLSERERVLRELDMLAYVLRQNVRVQRGLAGDGYPSAPSEWGSVSAFSLRAEPWPEELRRFEAPPAVLADDVRQPLWAEPEPPKFEEDPEVHPIATSAVPIPEHLPAAGAGVVQESVLRFELSPESLSLFGSEEDDDVVEEEDDGFDEPSEEEPEEEPALHPSGRPRYPWEDESRRKGPAHAVGRVEEGVTGLAFFKELTTQQMLPQRRPQLQRLGPTPTLPAVREVMGACERCGLCRSRENIVFGSGSPTADLIILGSMPSAADDSSGEPFSGPEGGLLMKIVEAMGLGPEQVYMTHVVKCRPAEDRPPERGELAACYPFLSRQIKVIEPAAILVLGPLATRSLLRTTAPFDELRGRWQPLRGESIVMPTLHPSLLLRDPSAKRVVWEDAQAVMERLRERGALRP